MATITIAEGVEFHTIAREWRLKWSPDNDKESLVKVQKLLVEFTAALGTVDGVKSVQRIVCGGCLDFKVVTSVSAEHFSAWEAKGFTPEAEFLVAVSEVPGVSVVETQTYTIMPVAI